jgi:hypothetical protein
VSKKGFDGRNLTSMLVRSYGDSLKALRPHWQP